MMSAFELIGRTPAGRQESLGVFGSDRFAASVRAIYAQELGDEYVEIRIREVEDAELVILEPGEPANEPAMGPAVRGRCPRCGLGAPGGD